MDKLKEAIVKINQAKNKLTDDDHFADWKLSEALTLLREHEREIEDYHIKDAAKTREINILVPENRKLQQENERLRDELKRD